MKELIKSSEHEAIRACLLAAADGPFFPDWEFETLIGSSRDEVWEIAIGWPGKMNRESIEIAVCVINNLVGYPHGEDRKLAMMAGVSSKEVEGILDKLSQLARSMNH